MMDNADQAEAEATGRIRLVSCIGVDLELALLPFFLDHYIELGIQPEDVHLIFNASDAASANLDRADALARERRVAVGERWIAPYTSEAMWAERRALQARVARPGDWIVNADVDEFHRYPAPLAKVIEYLRERRLGALQGVMIDRLAVDGALHTVRNGRPLEEQFPVRADVSLSVIGTGETHGVAGTIKLMVHRHDVEPRRGGHTVLGGEKAAGYAAGARLSVFPHARRPDWRGAYPFQVDHYKWTGTLRTSLAARLAASGVSVAGREYGGKIDCYLARHGAIRLEDAAVLPPAHGSMPDWRSTLDAMRRAAPFWKARNAVRHHVDGARRRVRKLVAR